MATFNRVMLMGRLTADPDEPRVLPNSGATLVKFRMAVGRSRKNQQTGQWENDPNPLYIDCEVFTASGAKRDLCGLVTKYVRNGHPVFVEGRLQLDSWADKASGERRAAVEAQGDRRFHRTARREGRRRGAERWRSAASAATPASCTSRRGGRLRR